MLRKMLYVLQRVLAAIIVAIIVMLMPAPGIFPPWLVKLQMPVTIVLLICYLGKLLYDTLFYDHYRP